MAGAVAFVFGLCALSFAAGCVVTAIMLRAPIPDEETAQPSADPVVPAPQPEQLELRLLSEDFSAKPIHRNPVVGRPIPVALKPAVPDLMFIGVFDPPGPLLPLPDSADEVPESRSEGDSVADADLEQVREAKLEPVSQPSPEPEADPIPAGPEPETTFVPRSGLVTESEPVPAHLEAVVPEQGTIPEPELVPTQQIPVPTDEFRERYLRTFEAARRRSSH